MNRAGRHRHHVPAGVADPSDGARRGVLTVTPRAVEKIAAMAAAEVPAVGPPPSRRLLGRGSGVGRGSGGGRGGGAGAGGGRPGRGRPRVSARVADGAARVSMAMSVRYPEPVGPAAELVRARVRDRVAALAGLRVTRIDIRVEALRVEAVPGEAPRTDGAERAVR
jgi:uncharacterized alkaline shock family protein YloU